MSELLLQEFIKSGILVAGTALVLKIADTKPGRRVHGWMQLHWRREFMEFIPLTIEQAQELERLPLCKDSL